MEFNFMLEPGKKQLKQFRQDRVAPLVTIITPFYNAGKYFEQTFLCVINQTFPWFEWLIVNDGSTKQEDVALLEELSNRDRRISIYHKENGGIASARNMAIGKSSTDIIIPLDADDLILPTYVECLYWGLFFHPEYDWCYTNNVGFQNLTYLWDENFDSERLRTYNFLVYSGAIRKQAIEEVGGYDETTKHFYEDWHLWLKLVSKNKKPVKLSLYGFWYRRLDTGVLSLVNNDPKLQSTAKQLIDTAAAKVRKKVEAKAYPSSDEKISYESLTAIPWSYGTVDNNAVKKQNLLLLIPWMEMGGSDIFNINVVKGLNKEKYHISILTTVPSENPWRQRFEEEIYDIFELPSFLDIRNYLLFLDYFIRTRDINIIFISNSYQGYYMLPWIREKYPHIIIMDYVHMEEWYWRNGGYARLSGVFHAFTDRTFTCNDRTKQVLLEHFKCREDKVKTLYIGTDIYRFDPEAVQKSQIYDRYSIDKKLPIILFPCRFHPQKRPFLMLEIVKRLTRRGRNFVVLAVGGGSQHQEVMERAKELHLDHKIIFAGEQSDMPLFYQDSFLTLICSIKEGVALTAFESLAMGTPVISTDVGGQKELITQEIGYLLPLLQDEEKDFDSRVFKEVEINQFTDAIEELLDDPQKYEEMSKRARQRIISQFSVEQMLQKLEAEIEELQTEEYQLKRQEASKALALVSGLCEETLLQYIENTISQSQKEKIWKERVWYQKLYQEIKYQPWKRQEEQSGLISRLINKLHSMARKAWQQRVRYTLFGKLLRKCKASLFHKADSGHKEKSNYETNQS